MRAVLAILIAFAPTSVWAQGAPPTDEVESLAQKAKAHYAAGRFNDAISVYLQAYQLAPAAGLLYNIAHIYDRKLEEPDLAIQFYRRYAGAPSAEPAIVMKANTRVQELKVEKRKAEMAALAPPPRATPTIVAPVEPREASNVQRTTGWLVLGAGVVVAGVGAVFGVQASSSFDDFDRSTDLNTKQTAREDGESQALTADVFYGVGGAAVIVGAILLLTAPDAESSSAIRVTPTDDLQGAAVWLGGTL